MQDMSRSPDTHSMISPGGVKKHDCGGHKVAPWGHCCKQTLQRWPKVVYKYPGQVFCAERSRPSAALCCLCCIEFGREDRRRGAAALLPT